MRKRSVAIVIVAVVAAGGLSLAAGGRRSSSRRSAMQIAIARQQRAEQVAFGRQLLASDAARGPVVASDPLPHDGLTRAERRARQDEARRGVHIKTNHEAEDAELDLHARIVKLFDRDQPIPDDRVAHFAWVGGQAEILGWEGEIASVADNVVTVIVRPSLRKSGINIAFTPDTYRERYSIADGGLTYLGGEGPENPRQSIIGD